MILFDGSPGRNGAASGGGAGGSILISTFLLRGYGSIHANGGRGFANGEFEQCKKDCLL